MITPFETDLALRLMTALAIGLVVGVERGWRERTSASGSRTAGVRTYALSGLLGGVIGAASMQVQSAMLAGFGFVGFAFVFALFKYREAVHDDEYSVTGVIAAMLVFALGAYAVIGSTSVAAGGGVAVAGLLASREFLHGILAKLTWAELRSALLILAMSVIILPLLPDRTIDPFGGLNLREVWLFAILVATISYIGYVALKLFAPQSGIALSALIGAVVSSTAVTLDLARRSRAVDSAAALTGGASLAAMVSALRVLLIVALLKASLAAALAPTILAAALVFGLTGLGLLWRLSLTEDAEIAPGNPFELSAVLAFAAIFATVSVFAQVLATWFGTGGLLAAAAASALADVDAAVLAAVRVAGNTIPETTAVSAVLLAMAVNALARNAYALILGSKRFAGFFGAATLAALIAAAAIHFLWMK